MIWFQDADIVTMDDASSVLKGGHVWWIREFISTWETKEPEFSEKEKVQTILCPGKCVMPGFYNAHTHVPMTLLRSYGEELTLERWLNERYSPPRPAHRETVTVASELAMAEMLSFGTVPFPICIFSPKRL